MFLEEAMRMQVRVNQAVHKAVRHVVTHNQVVQENFSLQLFKAVGTAI